MLEDLVTRKGVIMNKKQQPALLDSDVHGAFMRIKSAGSLSSISAAMRKILKEHREMKKYINNQLKDK